jgi:hypothetical protein
MDVYAKTTIGNLFSGIAILALSALIFSGTRLALSRHRSWQYS